MYLVFCKETPACLTACLYNYTQTPYLLYLYKPWSRTECYRYGYRLEHLVSEDDRTALGALAEHLADSLFISTASNLFVPFKNLS
jgi:hypothetical protein